jgi:hypothetical protein
MQQSAENDREKAAPSAGEGIKTGLISASGFGPPLGAAGEAPRPFNRRLRD